MKTTWKTNPSRQATNQTQSRSKTQDDDLSRRHRPGDTSDPRFHDQQKMHLWCVRPAFRYYRSVVCFMLSKDKTHVVRTSTGTKSLLKRWMSAKIDHSIIANTESLSVSSISSHLLCRSILLCCILRRQALLFSFCQCDFCLAV
jgi:hypothetical protein